MLNFNLFSKALCDSNLSDSEFRLLCLILINMNDTDELRMHNGYIMEKLDLCERQARRLTAALVDKGYITKEIVGTSKSKQANIYRMVDKTCAEMRTKMSAQNDTRMEDKNVPPLINNNQLNNKSILINREKSIENNIDYIDLGNKSNETNPNDSKPIESNTTKESQTISSNQNNQTISTNESNISKSADEVIKWLNSTLDEYFKAKEINQCKAIESNISNYLKSIDNQYFTENQSRAISAIEKRFDGIKAKKAIYLNQKGKINTPINASNESNQSISTNGINPPQIAPHPPKAENQNDGLSNEEKGNMICEWYNTTIDNYTCFEEWEKDFETKYIEIWGKNWNNQNLIDAKTFRDASNVHDEVISAAKEYINDNEFLESGPSETNTQKDTDDVVYNDDGEIIDLPF